MELLEFLLRLTEVLFVSVNRSCSLALAPVLREESVQTVWREFALRYSLSDVLVSLPSAVAAAQLVPIASCADVKRPEILPVIPPLDLRGSCGLLLLLLFRLGLCFLDPVGDCLVLWGYGRLMDLSLIHI